MNKKIPSIPAIGIIALAALLAGTVVVLIALQIKSGLVSFYPFESPQPKDETAQDETAGWQTYRNEENGFFEFKYPENWKFSGSGANLNNIIYYALFSPDNYESKSFYLKPISVSVNLGNTIDISVMDLDNELDYKNLKYQEDILVDNIVSKKMVFGTPEGEFVLVAIPRKEKNVVYSLVCRDSDYIDIFNRVVSTFGFIDESYGFNPPNYDISDWNEYIKEDAGYKIKYPPDWYLKGSELIAVGKANENLLDRISIENMRDIVVINTAAYIPDGQAFLSIKVENTGYSFDEWINYLITSNYQSYRPESYRRAVEELNIVRDMDIGGKRTDVLLRRYGHILYNISFINNRKLYNISSEEYLIDVNGRKLLDNILSTFKFIEGGETGHSETYRNEEYGFEITLLDSWEGYSVLMNSWSGRALDDDTEFQGPTIRIRHPEWTVTQPWQDIPIMVFTKEEWELVEADSLIISAAPIGPGELDRNQKYVFALPPRWVGFKDTLGQNEAIEIAETFKAF